jgi:hypothetical protein
MTNVATGQLIVSKPTNTGQLARLGTLNFDESNHATLSLDDAGPAAEELKMVWQEISSRNELTWKHSQPDEIDGATVMRIVGETAKPGDFAYIYAVMNTLERKYGYRVDLTRP